MKYFLLIFIMMSGLIGCTSIKVAENVKLIAFKDKESNKVEKSLGNVEGKDCTWRILGYPLGFDPNVRNAFVNTSQQTEETVPFKNSKKAGVTGDISYLRNVSVNPSGFSAYIVGRSCINVTGVGFQ